MQNSPLDFYVTDPIHLREQTCFYPEREVVGRLTFIVGKQEESVYAPKDLLVNRSLIFRELILNQKVDEVKHPQYQPHTFRVFLKFLHTDTLSPYAKDPEIIDLLRISVEYKIPALAQRCTETARRTMCLENCVQFYQAAILCDQDELRKISFKYMLRDAPRLLEHPQFLNLQPTTLSMLMGNDEFVVSEIQLFRRLLLWSEEECKRQKLPTEVERKYHERIVGTYIRHIRFPLMSCEDFIAEVLPMGLLTESEIHDIQLRHNTKADSWYTLPACAFLDRHRSPKIRFSVPCYQNGDKYPMIRLRRGGLQNSFNKESVRFLASQDIYLVAIGFFGPFGVNVAPVSFNIDFTIHNEFMVNYWRYPLQSTTIISKENFEVELNHPIKIERQQPYTLTVWMQGPVTQFGNFPVPQAGVLLNDKGDMITFHFGDTDSNHCNQKQLGIGPSPMTQPETKGIIRGILFTLT